MSSTPSTGARFVTMNEINAYERVDYRVTPRVAPSVRLYIIDP
jgi:hypothetical protein